MTKKGSILLLLILSAMALSATVLAASAQDDGDDPSIFVIATDAHYIGGTGWYAGYMIEGESGTYTMNISLTGPAAAFPVTDIRVIAAISDEAQSGGLRLVQVNGVTLNNYTASVPTYYNAQGGPFSEPDYYGYNDQYIIPELTYEQSHFPTNWYQITVTVQFAPDATQNSKVVFLCYGTDHKGLPAKTPFSGGTLFMAPEYTVPALSIVACLAAFSVVKKWQAKKINC